MAIDPSILERTTEANSFGRHKYYDDDHGEDHSEQEPPDEWLERQRKLKYAKIHKSTTV